MFDSLAVAAWPGRVLGAVLLGDPDIVLGVIALDLILSGLDRSPDGPSWLRTEYGPAVAGRAAISGRLLAGRMGATDMPPCDFIADSGRTRVPGCDEEAADVVGAVRIGDSVAIADPGLAGRFLVAKAFFCAITVSRNEGLELPMVLLERPKPGRATGSDFFGTFGLPRSFWSSFCAVVSRPFMIVSALFCQADAYAQYVDRIFSRTPGFGSARPLLMHFSIRSKPPPCSRWFLW